MSLSQLKVLFDCLSLVARGHLSVNPLSSVENCASVSDFIGG